MCSYGQPAHPESAQGLKAATPAAANAQLPHTRITAAAIAAVLQDYYCLTENPGPPANSVSSDWVLPIHPTLAQLLYKQGQRHNNL